VGLLSSGLRALPLRPDLSDPGGLDPCDRAKDACDLSDVFDLDLNEALDAIFPADLRPLN